MAGQGESPESSRQLIGKQLGNFKLCAWLGSGGSAHVYRGEQIDRSHIVRAIKVIRPEKAKKLAWRFAEEERLLGELSHDNIVRFFAVGQTPEYLWIEFELLEGCTLAKMLEEFQDRKEHPPIATMARIILHVAKGVAFAHEHKKGVVHRDIKPANIFVCHDESVKILDFGIARALDEEERESATTTQQGQPGTALYMAPELLENETPTLRSDVYSLGLTLMEAILGRHPFEQVGKAKPNFAAILAAHVMGKIRPLGEVRLDVPKSLEQVALRATARRADDRYASAREFANALHDALEGEAREQKEAKEREAKAQVEAKERGAKAQVEAKEREAKAQVEARLRSEARAQREARGQRMVEAQTETRISAVKVLGAIGGIILIVLYVNYWHDVALLPPPLEETPVRDDFLVKPLYQNFQLPVNSTSSASATASSLLSESSTCRAPFEAFQSSADAKPFCASPLVRVKDYDECFKKKGCAELRKLFLPDEYKGVQDSGCVPPTSSESFITCISYPDAEKYCRFRGGELPTREEAVTLGPFLLTLETFDLFAGSPWLKHQLYFTNPARDVTVYGFILYSKQAARHDDLRVIPVRQTNVGASFIGVRCIDRSGRRNK